VPVKTKPSHFPGTNSGSKPNATYSYDGAGKQVKKISSIETTVFVYDGNGQMIAEYSTALASTQQVSFITQDHLGSPRVITNENGAVTNRKDYMAFGDQALSAQRVSGSGGNKYDDPSTRTDYTGYEKDSESGLEFAQARYYNSQHGRFTTVDPMIASATIKNPQTFNRYSYVLNSPYKFSDPLGLLPMIPYTGCSAEASSCDKGSIEADYAEASIEVSESQTDTPNAAPAIQESGHDAEQPQVQAAVPPPQMSSDSAASSAPIDSSLRGSPQYQDKEGPLPGGVIIAVGQTTHYGRTDVTNPDGTSAGQAYGTIRVNTISVVDSQGAAIGDGTGVTVTEVVTPTNEEARKARLVYNTADNPI
jgi:RHS repeat-associated protein